MVNLINSGDMEHQRAVSVEKQTRFACDNNMILHNVSARTGENVSSIISLLKIHLIILDIPMIYVKIVRNLIMIYFIKSYL